MGKPIIWRVEDIGYHEQRLLKELAIMKLIVLVRESMSSYLVARWGTNKTTVKRQIKKR